jgi:hypothetical protein
MKPPTQTPIASRGFYWALVAIVAVFGAVRLGCAWNDLWLDEIWSLRLVQALHSPAEIVTRLWHDNNHPLNSLWLYLLGPGQAEWAYRLLSWFTGTVAVGLAGLIGRRLYLQLHPDEEAGRAQVAGLLTAGLVGGSYFLIHYSSEARGYAPAVGFVFLAVYALGHARERPAGGWAAAYGVACVLGLLSHLVTFQIMLAGLVWSGAVLIKHWTSWRDRWVHLVCWHLGPWVFLGIYYLGFVRKIEIGGGPKLALAEVLGTLAAFSLGFPSGTGVWLALPVFVGVTLLGLGWLWRRDRAAAGFFAVGIFVAPAVGLCSSRFVLLYPRYFIVSAALGLLVVAYVLSRLWHAQRGARVTVTVLLAGFFLGNTLDTLRLVADGRGLYSAALRYVADHSPPGVITVSSDADFRNFTVIDYYKTAVGPRHELRYFSANQPPPGGVQWVFLHRLDESTPVPPATVHDAEGRVYEQFPRPFIHAPLSGWEWYLYRRIDESEQAQVGR